MLVGWKHKLDPRRFKGKKGKIPLTMLKNIGNNLLKTIPYDCDCKPNKKHNAIVEMGGKKYFVVYKFITEQDTVLIREIKPTRK